MKREVDISKLIWRAVRIGALTLLITLLLLWIAAALLRWEILPEKYTAILVNGCVFLAAVCAQIKEGSKGMLSALLASLLFGFLLLLLNAGIPKTTIHPAELILPTVFCLLGALFPLLLHFNKTPSLRRKTGKKYNR